MWFRWELNVSDISRDFSILSSITGIPNIVQAIDFIAISEYGNYLYLYADLIEILFELVQRVKTRIWTLLLSENIDAHYCIIFK